MFFVFLVRIRFDTFLLHFWGLYLLDEERKEIEESPEIYLSVEEEMAGASVEDKVL